MIKITAQDNNIYEYEGITRIDYGEECIHLAKKEDIKWFKMSKIEYVYFEEIIKIEKQVKDLSLEEMIKLNINRVDNDIWRNIPFEKDIECKRYKLENYIEITELIIKE